MMKKFLFKNHMSIDLMLAEYVATFGHRSTNSGRRPPFPNASLPLVSPHSSSNQNAGLKQAGKYKLDKSAHLNVPADWNRFI